MPPASPVQQAYALAAAGSPAEALRLLAACCAEGNRDALLLMGLWQVEGRVVPRDLSAARERFADAAGLGQITAARILQAMTANGTGAAPDWPAAVALLRGASATDPLAARQLALIEAMAPGEDGVPGTGAAAMPGDGPVQIGGLFSAAECDFLAELADAKYRPAEIFHEGQQRFVRDPLRDSDIADFPLLAEFPVVHALNRRIAARTGTHVRQGEPLQVLRYAPGQQYQPHLDAVPGLANQRILTVLVWLNDAFEGGETDFPEIGRRFRGARGDALVFANVLPDGRPDPVMRHCGLPVTRGTKLLASRWIRARPAAEGEAFGPDEVGGRERNPA